MGISYCIIMIFMALSTFRNSLFAEDLAYLLAVAVDEFFAGNLCFSFQFELLDD